MVGKMVQFKFLCKLSACSFLAGNWYVSNRRHESALLSQTQISDMYFSGGDSLQKQGGRVIRTKNAAISPRLDFFAALQQEFYHVCIGNIDFAWRWRSRSDFGVITAI